MDTILALIPLALAAAATLFGDFVFYLDKKNILNRYFRLFYLISACTLLAEFLFMAFPSWQPARIMSFLGFLWPFMPVAAFIFTAHYTNTNLSKNRRTAAALFMAAFIISLCVFFLPDPGAARFLLLSWAALMTVVPAFLAWNFYTRPADNPGEKKYNLLVFLGFASTLVAYILTGAIPRLQANLLFIYPVIASFAVFITGAVTWQHRISVLRPESIADTLLGTMNEMFFLLNRNGKIIMANPAATKLLGYDEEELLGMSLDNFSAITKIDSAMLAGLARTGSISGMESVLVTKGEGLINILLFAATVKDASNSVRGYLFVAVNITEQKLLERDLRIGFEEMQNLNDILITNRNQLEQNNIKLMELDSMKNNFVSMITHELRTPLTSIIGFIKLLKQGAAGPVNSLENEYLSIINSNAERLLKLICELLDMSKLEAGTFSITKDTADLTAVMDSALTDISAITRSKNIDVIREYSAEKREAFMDSYRISQVIINLLNNAIKFSPSGSRIWINIRATDSRHVKFPPGLDAAALKQCPYYLVYVRDEGPGIPVEHINRVFDKFFQIASPGITKSQGVGLGLPITREIINAHGGCIWTQSEGAGRGSTFTFILPAL